MINGLTEKGGYSLHPIEFIQLMIASGILVFILFISFIFKGKRRKRIQGLALLFLLSFGIIYFVRPYWKESKLYTVAFGEKVSWGNVGISNSASS